MSNTIKFYYGFKEIELTIDPTSQYKATDTLLYYLRKVLKAKVTREGCGVGDCGACTVVIGEYINGRIKYYPVNSCLYLLPALDGKWLITSEHLANNGSLHPVQQALLEHYGVQCGFCTSGMLMSMLAMYKNSIHPTREWIEKRITGNLCRCTGYKPILEATIEACTGSPDIFTQFESEIIEWRSNYKATDFLYKESDSVYYRPTKLIDALTWHHKEQNSALSCGTSDIIVMHHANKGSINHILDLTGIEELREVTIDSIGVTIGAAVPIERVRESVKDLFPEISSLLSKFASFQVRQVASLAGNIASASPIGDSIPMLMAHKAIIRCAKEEQGQVILREVAATDFVTGYRKTLLEHNEIIHSIFIPKLTDNTKIYCKKITTRRSVDISTVSIGGRLKIEEGICLEAQLYFGGMAEQVKRATKAEAVLVGQRLSLEIAEMAANALNEDFTPLTDIRATDKERIELSGNLIKKFILNIL